MLPIATDNGARLAAILPSCISSLSKGLGTEPSTMLAATLGVSELSVPQPLRELFASLPAIRHTVVVVVDGLGSANLASRSAYARTLLACKPKRIETVIPSTTGAALTTLTTGRLPGEHGLVGYKIRHPQLGLITTLKGWDGIPDVRTWQLCDPLFLSAEQHGARAVAIGRPAHQTGGFTEATLTGARYISGQTIEERFSSAGSIVREEAPSVVYLYVDELDKAAHAYGWESEQWSRRLEQFDAALDSFLLGLPRDVGVIVTADHGIVDVPAHKQTLLDLNDPVFAGVHEIGGEPRMRSLYLAEESPGTVSHHRAAELSSRVQAYLGKRAWVAPREEAIDAGWFGKTSAEVAERLGDVLIAARGTNAFTLASDAAPALAMVGQHGSISDEERGIPLALAGAYAGGPFASIITRVAELVTSTK